MEIKILYEDKDIVAVDKPAGLIVHPDGKTEEKALTDWILKKYPEAKEVGEPITTSDGKILHRPGIVHRLDRDTSGVILIAKTKEGHACLKKQFQDHTISKKYLAFVHGEMKEENGIINRPIGRSSGDFRKWSAMRGTRGELRQAETHWSLIAKKDGYSLVEVEPKTGRTHQIRVHFKAVNHPVIHDELYAPDKEKFGFKRMALHALSIKFKNCEGKEVVVESLLPPDFKEAIKKIGATKLVKK